MFPVFQISFRDRGSGEERSRVWGGTTGMHNQVPTAWNTQRKQRRSALEFSARGRKTEKEEGETHVAEEGRRRNKGRYRGASSRSTRSPVEIEREKGPFN